MRWAWRRVAAPLAVSAIVAFGAGTVLGDTVTLKHFGGALEMRGEPISFDGKTYVIQSDVLGRTTLAAGDFACEGQGCPRAVAALDAAAPAASVVSIIGSSTIGTRLMPSLLRSYAASIQKKVKQQGEDSGDLRLELQDAEGKSAATIDLKRHGSDTAFPALAARQAQIGMSDRPISDQEIGALANAGFPEMNRPKQLDGERGREISQRGNDDDTVEADDVLVPSADQS